METALSVEESKCLLALCRTGRLYEVEDWLKSGKSLEVSSAVRVTPLQVAIETGFHSLIELLARNDREGSAKAHALLQAVQSRRLDFVLVLVEHGADTSSVPFIEVLRAWDPKLIRFFLARGADVITGSPFAEAFGEKIRTALRPFKECKESHPELADDLDWQANRALRYFSAEGNLKWVSLMLWAGADPRSKGPGLDPRFDDDPECHSTAIEEACSSGHLDVLRRFKLSPERDNLPALLSSAARFAKREIVRYLLELGTSPNDKPNGGSSALDACLWYLEFEDIRVGRIKTLIKRYGVYRTFDTLESLASAGALWRPSERSDALRVRRTLLKSEPDLVIDLFNLFKKTGACTQETIRDFLDTPRMRDHLKDKGWHLTRLGIGRNEKHAGEQFPYMLLARYDREKLYDEVWSQPMWKLAPEYGVSDVALAKTCKKLKIPTPGRGYWAKLAAGRVRERRPPLPQFPVAGHPPLPTSSAR